MAQSLVLRMVRDHAPISRSAIAQRTSMQLSAVSRAVSRLLARKVVSDTPLSDLSGPRRKRGLGLNPAAGHCISVEYDAAGLKGAIVDLAYAVRVKKEHPLPLGGMPKKQKIKSIVKFIEQLRSEASDGLGPCLAVAAVDPGIVDDATGVVVLSSTMDDWSNVPLLEILERALGLPTLLVSTSMASIRAVDRMELRGAADNVIYVQYEEGIGCGLKLAGHYVAGHDNLAGELGHFRVTDKPVTCRCGGLGCLEAIAALPAIARRAALSIAEGAHSSLTTGHPIDGPAVLAAAQKGDRLACHIVEEAFTHLGRAVGGMVNTLGPEVVVFDATVAKAGENAVRTLTEALRAAALPTHVKALDIRISAIPSLVRCLGGAVTALDHCLGD